MGILIFALLQAIDKHRVAAIAPSPLQAPIQYLLRRMSLLTQGAQAEGIVPLGQSKTQFIAQQIAMVIGWSR